MSAAVAAALTFNLFCTGQFSWSHDATATKPATYGSSPFSTMFVIDLQQGLYCEYVASAPGISIGCASVEKIARVDRFEIALQERESPVDTISETLNRTDGSYLEIIIGPGHKSNTHAMCEKRPFTGFPANKF